MAAEVPPQEDGRNLRDADSVSLRPIQNESPADAQRASEQLKESLDKVNEKLQSRGDMKIKFLLNEEGADVVVQIVDKESGEVIREIPPKEMRELAKRLEELRGVFVDQAG